MLYELRHYDVEGERGLRRTIQRFAEHVLPAFDRARIEAVGFWTVFVGPQSPRLTYTLAWEDLAQRQARWGAFEADEEWRRARAETNTAWGGSPIRVIANTILMPTPSSPLPRRDNQPSRLAGGIFEQRTYAFRDYESQAQCVGWLGEHCLPLFEKHRIHVMGLWTTYIGVTPRVTLMLVFESLADREQAWAACHTDPAWPAVEAELYPDGHSLIASEESCLMRGTEFSGWR
jgi:hypothetical protein